MTTKYTPEELIQNLKEKYIELGRKPKMDDMFYPFSSEYLKVFKTWKNALKSAGLDKVKTDRESVLNKILTSEKTKQDFSKCICCEKQSNGVIMKENNKIVCGACKTCVLCNLIDIPKEQRFEYFK